jgi:S-DNA-T family DNA segregation ATPase FtsK/SpoIIIE
MFENRKLPLDLLALALFALAIFLGAALATYSPADSIGELVFPLSLIHQQDPLVWPANETFHNACGRWGAIVSDALFSWLGLGAYYALFSLAVLDYKLLRRHEIDVPLLRCIGWFVSLFGGTTLIALTMSDFSPGPVIGAGGYLGALGKALAETHFATVGGVILATSVLLGGLLLCTDYALVRIGVFSVKLVAASVTGVRIQMPAFSLPSLRKRTDLEELEFGDHADVAIKLNGKGGAASAIKPAADEEDETDDEENIAPAVAGKISPASKPAAAAPAAKKAEPADGALRIRNPNDKKKELAEQSALKINESQPVGNPEEYELPSVELLLPGEEANYDEQASEVRRKAKILEKTFADFGFTVKVVEIETGPVIAQYEVELEAGLRLSKITGLSDDLAIALRVPAVRIVAPIPGKNTVGIEVPNETRQIVRLREVIEQSAAKIKKMNIPLFLGKDVSGNPLVADLSTLPHLLIAGRTGTGKSVCLNAIISSILMTRRPDEVRMLMIDPKMVELSGYGRLPHLMHPVVTDMRKAEAILAWAVEKMEERYALLARAGVRHISSYNQLGEEELMDRLQPEDDLERQAIPQQLPFIVIVADEIADLMMTAGKEVEQHIIRLAQKSRAVGIHLILATQKPTVDVITGLIKSNLPARIAFQVASRTDSRVVLDEMGADKLLGNGDMLFLWPGTSTLLRGQGTYLSDDEINEVVAFVSKGEQNFVNELVNIKVADPESEDAPKPGALKKRDELYEAAVDVVVREGRGSVSLLQRALGIGYGRGARLIDYMAEDGIVGQYNGSQAREVTISIAQWEAMQAGGEGAAEETPAPSAKGKASAKKSRAASPAPKSAAPEIPAQPKKRTNRILPEPDPEEETDEQEEDLWSEDEQRSRINTDDAEDEGAEDEDGSDDERDEISSELDDDLPEPAEDDDSIDAEARRIIKRYKAESA